MSQVFEFLAQQPVLLLFVVIGLGSAIGHFKVRGVGLGAAAVLLLSIGLSAWGASYGADLEIPEATGTLGLALFTFCVGLVSGATFFSSLRRSSSTAVAARTASRAATTRAYSARRSATARRWARRDTRGPVGSGAVVR